MSYRTSPGGQSEDGELEQSPVHVQKHDAMDFSLSDDDGDKIDSLDIKPPQLHGGVAQSSKYKKRSDGHYDKYHKHADKHKERHSRHSKHHREHKLREHYQKEKDYFKEKSSYEHEQFYQHHDIRYREHRDSSLSYHHSSERKYLSKKLKEESSSSKHRKDKYEEHNAKALHDLRTRLLSKRSTHGGTKSDDEYYYKEAGPSSNEEKSRVSQRDREEENESGLLVKEIINISTASNDGSTHGKRSKHGRFDKLSEEERLEQDLRRDKLLEAEREMARLKEQRERRHLEKQRKRQYEEVTFSSKRQKTEEIVLSDNSEPEEDIEEEPQRERSLSVEHQPEVDSERSDSHEGSSNASARSKSASSRSRSSSRSDDSDSSESKYNSGRSSPEDKQPTIITNEKEDTFGKSATEEEKESQENEEKREEIDNDLPPYFPAIQGCRSVEEFQCLNRIAEGTYGVVYRARDKRTNDIVALKRLKMEKEKEGFPITSLREINTLLKGQHANIVTVREIVIGSNMDKIFIVMDYIEHDLKSLMETMSHKKQTFTAGEVKCLLKQLLEAVVHLHDNWILHRDLKTSNLLLSHKGVLKVADFGLAREYGSPLKPYTPIVVTMWYRAPELLLCSKEYSTPIDIWSVGCIFAELLLMNPIFPGKSEVDQLNRIFKDLGTPNEKVWPGFNKLPAVMKMKFAEYPVSNLRNKFNMLTPIGQQVLNGFLTYDPVQRFTAEKALKHPYFTEAPLPIDPAMFPTWPAKSELGHRNALAASPKPPSGGREFKQLGGDDRDDSYGFRLGISAADSRRFAMGGGFNLKF